MQRIINYILIICLNLFIAFFIELDALHVICFFIALSLLFSSNYLKPTIISFFLPYIFLIVCIFQPLFFLFLPIISYAHATNIGKSLNAHAFETFAKFSSLIYIPILINSWESNITHSVFLFVFLISISILAFILEYYSCSYEKLNKKYIRSYDASRERQLTLNAKNEALIAKQNYEISLATMNERNRIARDIHDNVGHLLTRSILITGAIKTINKNESLKPSILSLDTTLNNAMTTIRESVHDLHTHTINLKKSIETLLLNFTFCEVSFTYHVTSFLPGDISYSFISIIKEALTNTSKHSNATKIKLRIQEHPALYQLIIEDNGSNIPKDLTGGIGLENMAERVSQLHGNFHIQTDRGFRIFITIPKGGNNNNENNFN